MDKIDILCATDEQYAPYYGVMLTSLFDNNKEELFDIFIMTAGLENTTLNKFKVLTNQYNAGLFIIKVDEDALRECPIRKGDHVSLATYYRLLSPILLPDIDKILYLDGDIIINGKIRPLWDTKLQERALAAVIDEVYYDKERHERLDLPLETPYFNAGVLLINLSYWRKNNIMEKSFECIGEMANKLLFHDQDTLNKVLCNNEVKYLPLTYNYQYGFIINYMFEELGEEIKKEVMAIRYNPIIIHFSGPQKPWQKHSRNPYAPLFLFYRKHSLWNDLQLISNFTWKETLRYHFNRFIWWSGIKKEFNSYIVERQFKNEY